MASRPFIRAKPPIDIGALGFRLWRARHPFRLPRPHTHSDVEVNFLLSGEVSYLRGGTVTTVRPFHFTTFWGGVPHSIVSPGEKTSGFIMTLPLAWLLEWRLPHDLPARLLGGELVSATPDAADLPLLNRWVADFESRQEERRRVLTLEIQARFHRLALEIPARPARRRAPRPSTPTGIGPVERSTQYIAQHYGEPLTVERIAAAVGLHGKYLMRLFKRHSGMNIWEYVTRMRLAHAQRLLLTTDMKIIDIAFEAGFGSLGPFYRAFAAYCPEVRRPLDYRRRMAVRTESV